MKVLKFLFFLLAAFCISIPFIFGYLVYAKQEKLLFPAPEYKIADTERIDYGYPDAKDSLVAQSGDRLQGWFLTDSSYQEQTSFNEETEISEEKEKKPTIIVFGGNGDKAINYIKEKLNGKFKGLNIAAYDYRGYGHSGGEPSEKALLRDSLSIYDHIAAKEEVDKEQIYVLGRSLGSGIACYLASQRYVQKLILVSPYDSMTKVAKKMYPWLPVSILLKHKFEAYKIAQKVESNTLILIAENDDVIEPKRSLTLAKYLEYKPEVKTLKGVNHSNIVDSEQYWLALNKFIQISENNKESSEEV